MSILNFIVDEVLSQPSILVGLMAMIGLIALKESFSKIVSGTLKSILGFIILGAGAGVLIGSLDNLGPLIQEGFNVQGVIPNNEAIVAIAQKTFGKETALIMGFGFIANLAIARFTPLKYVFLTGHHTFFMAALLSAVLGTAGMTGVPLIILGSILLGFIMVLMPALAQPFMRKITGNDDIALGHFGTVGYLAAGLTGKLVGNPEKSTEEVKVPSSLKFLKDSILSTAITMIVIFFIVTLKAGQEVVSKYSGGQSWFMFSIIQGLTFAAGVSVILMGVRMILGEIIPAFKGIAEKIVPEAKPALDCPIVFPYAPMAVIIGFLASFLGGVVGMFLMKPLGLAVIIPGMVPHFFTGATAGVFGNATGGKRGAIFGAFVNGLIITFLPALLLPVLGDLGFANTTFGDADFGLIGLIIGSIAKLF
ncbi:PTS system IIC component (L-Asc family) [Oceanotoga teriensis]|jgi:PTS system ascorbate-specific IIC component|uniref:Ascorbate-specific PTS system EIIC component n=1 Tax=Oceanotoga teriensis TaxID=515440 RepID=A0AA45HIF5_9BACT|nr:PTS ascorbate transporter subunit IIC [Oceanotoga teriensis]PWJ92076.1 PTS system IIC component (L-Asc family) [Oceanotoga teriensis]